MGATRHPGWDSDWEHFRKGPSWRRVVRGATADGSIEVLTVRHSIGGEAAGWTWTHRGPERINDSTRSPLRLVAMSAGYGTTAAAKRAADRYFDGVLAGGSAVR